MTNSLLKKNIKIEEKGRGTWNENTQFANKLVNSTKARQKKKKKQEQYILTMKTKKKRVEK